MQLHTQGAQAVESAVDLDEVRLEQVLHLLRRLRVRLRVKVRLRPWRAPACDHWGMMYAFVKKLIVWALSIRLRVKVRLRARRAPA